MRKMLIAAAVILLIAVLASIAPPGSQSNPAVNSLNHAKSIWLSCKAWAEDNNGTFPPSLEVLYPNYGPPRSNLVSPLMPHDPMGYIYTPGLKETTPGDVVLVEDKAAPSVKGERIVVYADGRARIIDSNGRIIFRDDDTHWPTPVPLLNRTGT